MHDSTASTPRDDAQNAPRFTIEDTGSTVDAADLIPDPEDAEALDEDTDPAA